jgi:hypothetical protein
VFTQAVQAPLEQDGAIVIVCVDREGAVRSVEVIPMYNRPGVVKSSHAAGNNLSEINQPGDAYNEGPGDGYEESDAYEEDDSGLRSRLFDIGLGDAIVLPENEPAQEHAHEEASGIRLPINKEQVHEEPAKGGRAKHQEPAKVGRAKHKEPKPGSTEEPARRAQPAPTNGGKPPEAPIAPEASTSQPETDSTHHSAVHRRLRSHIQDLQWILAIWAMGLTTVVVLAAVAMWCYTRGTIELEPYLHSGITTGTALAIGAVIAWAFKNVVDDKKKKDDDDA